MRIIRNQSGQGMTEYIIIVALIAVTAIAAFTYFGKTVRVQTDAMTSSLAGDPTDAATANADAAKASTSATKDASTDTTLKDYTKHAK